TWRRKARLAELGLLLLGHGRASAVRVDPRRHRELDRHERRLIPAELGVRREVHGLDPAQLRDVATQRALDAAFQLQRHDQPARTGTGEGHPDARDAVLDVYELDAAAAALEIRTHRVDPRRDALLQVRHRP